MNIHFEGVSDVTGMLDKFTDELSEKLSRGVAQGGKIVEGEARGLAPVRTHHLQESIHAHTEGLRCEVGTNVEYAIYQEFGTYKMKAHPYMMPALTGNKEAIINAIKAAVK